MNTETSALLQKLSNANGPSGFEDEVTQVILDATKGLGEQSMDSLLNCYIDREENTGDKPVIQLDAHMDEVGFIVQAIAPNGMLKILGLGGWITSSAIAQKVRVRNRDGVWVPGVIASKPPHFASPEDRNKLPDMGDLRIDIGSTSAEETAEVFGIEIAAPVVPDVDFSEIPAKAGWFIGKAFDDRIGCAAQVLTLQALAGENLEVDIKGTFSTQEEVGTRGAVVTAKRVEAALAICFEGTPADDTFGEPWMTQAAVGKGPMLRHFDATMITNPRFQRFALDLARELEIPCQQSVRAGGGTNAKAIHLAGNGVPTIVIGVPVRYIHSHYGIASGEDLENAAKLAAAICRKLTPELIAAF